MKGIATGIKGALKLTQALSPATFNPDYLETAFYQRP